jgi:hypothetical protein
MFHMQQELVEAIQHDRRGEAQTARFHTRSGAPRADRRRLFRTPSTIFASVRRTRTAVPTTSA